jgi:hypothetical protein
MTLVGIMAAVGGICLILFIAAVVMICENRNDKDSRGGMP